MRLPSWSKLHSVVRSVSFFSVSIDRHSTLEDVRTTIDVQTSVGSSRSISRAYEENALNTLC